MRKITLLLIIASAVFSGCDKYDDSSIKSDINDLKQRVAALEQQCKMMNENITSIQSILSAVQKHDGIVSVTDLPDGVGYSVLFSSGKLIYLYNGKNGANGRDGIDGSTPQISVRVDSDGIYYWTIDGEWMIVDGKKVKAIGTDGKDAITPQLKIEDDFWYVTYDEGNTWIKLSRAKGDDGKDSDNIFKSVTAEDGYVVFVLNDLGQTTIKVPLAGNLAVTCLKYIPEYSDLGAVVTCSVEDEKIVPQPLLMKFDVMPADKADDIVKNWKECISAKVVYTYHGTRAEAGDFVNMEIISATADNDILSIEIVSDGLSYDELLSKSLNNSVTKLDAYIQVSVSDNNSTIRSDYIRLCPVRQGDIEYETEDGTALNDRILFRYGDLGQDIIYEDYYIAGRRRIFINAKYDKNNLNCKFHGDNLRSVVFPYPKVFDSMDFFYGLNLTSVEFKEITTKNISFSDCRKLENLDLSNVVVIGGTDKPFSFIGCSSLKSLILPKFKGNYTLMSSMFLRCSNLKSLDLSKFDTGNVVFMNSMFSGCSSLTLLNLSKFKTSNVTHMSAMFYGCSSLTLLDLSKFKTNNVIHMDQMFYGCSKLENLNLSGWTIKDSATIVDMFKGCDNLKTIEMRGCDSGTVSRIRSVMPVGVRIIQ